MATPRKKAAAKKKVAAKKALAPRQGTQVANLQQRLQNMAKEQNEQVQPSQNNKIEIHNDSQFKLPDGSIVNAPMPVVILSFMARNTYYEKAYKEGTISPVTCAAQGFRKNDDLIPYPAEELIDQQADACKDCWANQYGSAPQGDGKACKNRKEIAVIGVNTDDEGTPLELTGEMLRFETSPIGTGKYDTFVDKLSKRYSRPVCCFLAEADIMPAGPKNYTVYFSNEQMLPEELVLETVERVEEAKVVLDVKPLMKAREEEQPAKRPSKKKAASRRR